MIFGRFTVPRTVKYDGRETIITPLAQSNIFNNSRYRYFNGTATKVKICLEII